MEKKIINKELQINERKIVIENIATDIWQYTVLLSHTNVKNAAELNLLLIEDNKLFHPEITSNKTEFTLTFATNGCYEWSQSVNLTYLEKLRLCLNIYPYYELIDRKQTYWLEPENMFYDENLLPKMVYRGLQQLIEPITITDDDFLKQYKSIVIATLSPKHTFMELYNGALSLAKDSSLIREIAIAQTVEKVRELLEEIYFTEKKKTARTTIIVKKSRYNIYSRLTYISLLAVIIFTGTLSYLGLNVIPYQNNLLEADSAFISLDYERVISILRTTNVEKLPQTNKYVLAYSYIQGEALSNEQRTVILNNISLKSEPSYLLFWIHCGMGNFDKAIDLAKSLQDIELAIYGLENKIAEVRIDNSISGARKEEELATLNEELNKFKTEFMGAINLEVTDVNFEDTTENQVDA